MKSSYEELEIELAQTKEELVQTQLLLKHALERIVKLEEQINKNSKNSSKPPSLDQKPNTPDKSKRKRKGRQGFSRQLIPQERVDRKVECTLSQCPCCHSSELRLKDKVEVLQQIELPETRAIATEYFLYKYECKGCEKNCSGSLPDGIPYSAFGPKIMALVATLTGGYLLPKRDAIQLIKDLYEVDIGLGSMPNIEERVCSALEDVWERIHNFVMQGDLSTHFDETGWRNSGKRHFVWIACNDVASVFQIDRSRSSEAFNRFSRGKKDFCAVTDRYAVYNQIEGPHQYCLAHLIRDFRQYAQRDGPDSKLGAAIKKVLQRACKIHAGYRKGKRSWNNRTRMLEKLKKRLEEGFIDGLANGSDQLANLCEKLLDSSEHIWAFVHIKGMEPTNNLAERNLRNVVIRRKRSYGTRSDRGRRFIEVITSVGVTARQRGINLYSFIKTSISKYFSREEAPLMSPALDF